MTIQNQPIRVLVVDDHAVVRSGLSAFLTAFDNLELVGEAENGEDAIQKCARVHPDVILMDLMMPVMDGVTATRNIRERYPQVQVIALTSFKDDESVKDALKSGAISYLLKNASANDLAEAIQAAYEGQPTLSPEAAKALVKAAHAKGGKIKPGQDLTQREREVLTFLVEGYSNPDIAKQLVVSHSTIKYHVSSILAKLGARSRTEAVAIAVKNHLVN